MSGDPSASGPAIHSNAWQRSRPYRPRGVGSWRLFACVQTTETRVNAPSSFKAQTQTRERLVVIGNGMAGCRAVEEILARNPERYAITIFGAEPRVNYNRI